MNPIFPFSYGLNSTTTIILLFNDILIHSLTIICPIFVYFARVFILPVCKGEMNT